MSSHLVQLLLWAQASGAAPAAQNFSRWRKVLFWLFLYGEPAFTPEGLLGGWLLWIRGISLLCFVCWVGAWIVTAIKERCVARGGWFDYVGLAAVLTIPVTMLIRTLEASKQMPVYAVGPVLLTSLLSYLVLLVIAFWIELGLWRTVLRFGKRADVLVLVGMHLAIFLGLAVGVLMQRSDLLPTFVPNQRTTLGDGLVYGLRLSVTYMGYAILARIFALLIGELLAMRSRRIYSIAQLSVHEANRRMWAPWVVLIVFALVLAFTHWFLQPPRAAEMGRLYVATLILVCSLLLTVMVTILTPLSLPTDIQQQTIYTVVSKPVRRLELIWGRMVGFMALVTVLIAIFGAISLGYLWRTVYDTITRTEAAAVKAKNENRTRDFAQLMEQADQLRSRMAARVPVKGSLSFLDSRGTPHAMGIDVGMEQSTMKEPRSHIEGATPAAAIWSFGSRVVDPFSPANRPKFINRKIPVQSFLPPSSVEGLLDRMLEVQFQIVADERAKAQADLTSGEITRLEGGITRNRALGEKIRAEYEAMRQRADDLEAQAAAAEAAGKLDDARSLFRQSRALHADPITIEMTFNVYRTTKGKVGEPVLAEMQVSNPHTGKEEITIFPIKEYYTNRRAIKPETLAGSLGDLRIEVRCVSPTQYLGMAESDLYLLSSQGNFGENYMKGLFGVWLQAMVLTAIGVFAGTFLSWPVALLTTVVFFFAGQLAYSFLIDFSRQSIVGGGPFESLIRLLGHENQLSELAPTAGVIVAKTLDSLLMPVMSMFVYVVPNFQALDVSNTVADGFAVGWSTMLSNTLLALAYTLPFSIVGYFILRNREVAA
ncbi:MAG: ABC transporter permease [Isosphaeraceae bacterium]